MTTSTPTGAPVSVTFDVVGDPSPQSGMKPQGRNRNGSLRLVSTGGVNLRSWRDSVAAAARTASTAHGITFDGPVIVIAQFRHPMPASRPALARHRGMVVKSTIPDLDKLQRALGDSLKAGGLIVDDGRIAGWYSSKVEVWQAWTGARVSVRSFGAGDILFPDLADVHNLMWGANP